MKILIKVTLLIFFASSFHFSQVVFTPADDKVYDFLERLSLKNIIEFHNEVLPKSRKDVADLLKTASGKKFELNEIEQKELDWYFAEYAYELGLNKDEERWFLFSYSDSLFSFKVSPIAGYGISRTGNESGHTRWWGGNFFGTYSDWFGAAFNARDRGEFGGNVDKEKNFTPVSGASYISPPGGIEYSDVKGSINFDFKLGRISLIKDNVKWGNGKFGQLILSQKAPSFPFIRFDLYPADWFRFYYIHGFLNSMVFDSSAFYYSNVSSVEPYLRKDYVNKYIAANLISISPLKWLDVSFGNSIIYSGKIRPEFFIPFMFFKYLDRDTGHGSVADGNGQFYIDIAARYPRSFFFYTTLFVDVIEIRNVLKNDFHNTWFGFTLGGKKVDLLIPNFDLTLEYTRINPWVYEHKDEVTTYTHVNYTLGHWLGQNADQFRIQLDYTFLRGLKIKAYTEFLRKGGLLDIYFAYKDNNREEFLYSPLRNDKAFGLDVSYEFIHDLFANFSYKYSDISDESSDRTPSFLSGKKHTFSLVFFYGM